MYLMDYHERDTTINTFASITYKIRYFNSKSWTEYWNKNEMPTYQRTFWKSNYQTLRAPRTITMDELHWVYSILIPWFSHSVIAVYKTSIVALLFTHKSCPLGLLPGTLNCCLLMRRECRERFPRHWFQESGVRSQESGVFYLQQQKNIASNNDGDTTTQEATQRYNNKIDSSLKRNNNLEWC